jgi:hypothetical protein
MPLTVSFTVWAMVAFLVLFFGVGAVVGVRAFMRARREQPTAPVAQTLRERADAYVGPVPRESAPLGAPLRVLIEFCCALFGFAGLGWALSTRLVAGLALMLLGPIWWWFVWPIVLDKAGVLQHNVMILVYPLPVFAACSAGALALVELRAGRHAEHTGRIATKPTGLADDHG